MRPRAGIFVPTIIPFDTKKADTNQAQAVTILRHVQQYVDQGYDCVGITYSANRDQSEEIRRCYASNKWLTATSGGNQAAVIAEVESLLAQPKYSHLQGKFRILPISSCAHSGGVGAVQDAWLDEELLSVSNFLKNNNNAVIGWQNQHTNGDNFPVGGGISQQLTVEQKAKIQTGLRGFKNTYPQPAADRQSTTTVLKLALDDDNPPSPVRPATLPPTQPQNVQEAMLVVLTEILKTLREIEAKLATMQQTLEARVQPDADQQKRFSP